MKIKYSPDHWECHPIRPELGRQLKRHAEKCIECPLCRRKCHFLKKYGTPKSIAESYDPLSGRSHSLPYECSLCGLCGSVCPVKLDPAEMFLEMRRESVAGGRVDFKPYRLLLRYEAISKSGLFAYLGLPRNCETVLFPGCALSGSRAPLVGKLFEHLSGTIPQLGLVLNCCAKPSHDLGVDNGFRDGFTGLKNTLLDHGVRTVLVACPSCFKMFQQYGGPLEAVFVYEPLEKSLPVDFDGKGEQVMVHDPCSSRGETSLHATIRKLILNHSLSLKPFANQERQTLCCGEGGAVCHVNGELASEWGRYRKDEAGGVRIVTYCAGCAHFLNRMTPAGHILDLVFDPQRTLQGRCKTARPPVTYFNRLRLKYHFKKMFKAQG